MEFETTSDSSAEVPAKIPAAAVPEQFRPSRGVGISTWLVQRATSFLEARSSRRGFLVGTAVTGSAFAVAGVRFATQPGTAYAQVTGGDCPPGSLCHDGFTEFCCSINNGVNACPPGSFAGGWWRADFSSFCNGTRYYIDCMQDCCGPTFNQGGRTWCAGCVACQCGPSCDNRKVYCNYFRYGQCHQEIPISGPIACRVVTCVPPYVSDLSCTPASAVDNETAEHNTACNESGPPPVIVPPLEVPRMFVVVARNIGGVAFAALIGPTGKVRDFQGPEGAFGIPIPALQWKAGAGRDSVPYIFMEWADYEVLTK